MKEAMKAAGISKRPEGYFDEAGNLRLKWVSRSDVEPLVRDFAAERLTSTQLRRFFNHCRTIEGRLRGGKSTWDAERPNFVKLSAFADDALAKEKIGKTFHRFLEQHVAMVQSQEDFLKGFMEHFQAVVGFAALHLKEERGR